MTKNQFDTMSPQQANATPATGSTDADTAEPEGNESSFECDDTWPSERPTRRSTGSRSREAAGTGQ